jgi:hypothetical protein
MPGGVTITQNNVEKVFRQIALGTARALNRSMATARTQAARDVAANVGVAQHLVRDRLVLEKATVNDLEATLRFTGKRFRLIDLPPARRPAVPHSFLATMHSGHTGIFVRKSPSHSRVGKPRHSPQLGIRELYAVSVPYVATKQHILESTLQVASDAFEKNAARDVSFATSGGV